MLDINESHDTHTARLLAEKLKNGKWVVLYHAKWCPHCVNFLPVFDKLAKMNHNNASFAKIEYAHHNDQSLGFTPNVAAYPTIKLHSNNNVVATRTGGSNDTSELTRFVRSKFPKKVKSKCAMTPKSLRIRLLMKDKPKTKSKVLFKSRRKVRSKGKPKSKKKPKVKK